MKRTRRLTVLVLGAALAIAPQTDAQAARTASAGACPPGGARCITVSFREAAIQDVIASFAEVSGYSIVLGSGIGGTVTAEIRNQPWDVALQVLLQAQGLAARETHPGIIRVDSYEWLAEREVQEPLVTQVFRINYVPVQEIAASLEAVKSPRGSISTNPSTNQLIVTDTAAGVARIAALLGQRVR